MCAELQSSVFAMVGRTLVNSMADQLECQYVLIVVANHHYFYLFERIFFYIFTKEAVIAEKEEIGHFNGKELNRPFSQHTGCNSRQ